MCAENISKKKIPTKETHRLGRVFSTIIKKKNEAKEATGKNTIKTQPLRDAHIRKLAILSIGFSRSLFFFHRTLQMKFYRNLIDNTWNF